MNMNKNEKGIAPKLTEAQRNDLERIAATPYGGCRARTGRALFRLGLVAHNPGNRATGTPSGWRLTDAGRAALKQDGAK